MLCPDCQATAIVKNGHTHYGKQRFKCNDCGRQFVEAATREIVGVYVGDRSSQSALKLWQEIVNLTLCKWVLPN